MTPDVTRGAENLPDDMDALRAALLAERTARREAEARATGAEAMIAHLKLLIAKLQRDRFGPTSERSRRLLDQLELQLEELEADAAEAEAKRPEPGAETRSTGPRAKPVRGPLPAHLPRERVVIPGPTECPCCQGKLSKLGETITETLEVIPRQWKVIQHVREKFTCRDCEAISQAPAVPGFVLRHIDDHTFEADISKEQNLNELFAHLSTLGINVLSMRNKVNRLEEIFMRLVENRGNGA